MFVVTASDGCERSGCLVGFVTQCSIEPRRFLVCLSKRNHTYRIATRATHLAVHPLHADQLDLSELFGEQTSDEIDKFSRCANRPGPHRTTLIEGCDWFVGRIRDRVDLGDHTGHVLDVVDAGAGQGPDGQLGFQAVRAMRPGHQA